MTADQGSRQVLNPARTQGTGAVSKGSPWHFAAAAGTITQRNTVHQSWFNILCKVGKWLPHRSMPNAIATNVKKLGFCVSLDRLHTLWFISNTLLIGLPQIQFRDLEPKKINKSVPNQIEEDFFQAYTKMGPFGTISLQSRLSHWNCFYKMLSYDYFCL